jgi:hypothetical protein
MSSWWIGTSKPVPGESDRCPKTTSLLHQDNMLSFPSFAFSAFLCNDLFTFLTCILFFFMQVTCCLYCLVPLYGGDFLQLLVSYWCFSTMSTCCLSLSAFRAFQCSKRVAFPFWIWCLSMETTGFHFPLGFWCLYMTKPCCLSLFLFYFILNIKTTSCVSLFLFSAFLWGRRIVFPFLISKYSLFFQFLTVKKYKKVYNLLIGNKEAFPNILLGKVFKISSCKTIFTLPCMLLEMFDVARYHDNKNRSRSGLWGPRMHRDQREWIRLFCCFVL